MFQVINEQNVPNRQAKYSWLSKTDFHEDDMDLGGSLVNESEYIGKKLSTITLVHGRLFTEESFACFYDVILQADK